MATSTIKAPLNVTGQAITLGETNFTAYRSDSGNVSFYGQLTNLSGNDSYINLGTLPKELRPVGIYAFASLRTTTSPYAEVGTIWISHGGAVTLYKQTGVTTGYVYADYSTGL